MASAIANDPSYYNSNKIIRPYRVGVSCGACHIAPLPTNPPADPENPGWANLASAIGNQYIREGKVFACNVEKGGFFYEELASAATRHVRHLAHRHGSHQQSKRDQSHLPPGRAGEGRAHGKNGRRHAGASGQRKRRWRCPTSSRTARIPIGVPGATHSRLRQHRDVFRILADAAQPSDRTGSAGAFEIPYAREHSVFWRATEERLDNIAAFFRKLQPYHLADAPGGDAHITQDAAVMTRGREVFAESCAACHSSKQPPRGNRSRTRARARNGSAKAVMKPDFLENNFLSNELRYPLRQDRNQRRPRFRDQRQRRSHLGQFFFANLQGAFGAGRSQFLQSA